VFFFQAEDGIRDFHVTGVQTCALPIWEKSERGKEGNIASRMPRGVIGIDVDATRGKPGADTFRELIARYGELPTHPVSSAADGRSEERRVGKGWTGRGEDEAERARE